MAFEYLKPLFEGKEHLTFDELSTALEGASNINLVNLKDGGYVAKDKYDRTVGQEKARADGLQEQLTAAHNTIQSYKEMNPEQLKQSVSEWEQRYATDTEALNQKMAQMEQDFAVRDFMRGHSFTSDLAKEAVIARFKAQSFTLTDGKFGSDASDWMNQLREANPGAFVVEEAPSQPPQQPPVPTKKPHFAPTKESSHQKTDAPMTATERMKWANEHPNEPWPW